MDFGTLLCNASKNIKKEPIRYYSTKFSPPKKEQKNKSGLSVNVKKFLEKKEQEEKQKMLEAQKKKEELLALRSKDKKAVKRVNVMLKRTKSANQSVIEDAVDSDNTAVTLAGSVQPDEDDYGYVSQEASAFYNKMMEKYSKMPEEPPKFLLEKKKVNTNLNSTKDRVKAALEKEKEEAMMPHRRKRKHKSEDGESSSPSHNNIPSKIDDKPDIKKPKTDKPKPKMPPPMNFNELLKLAEKKQFEPIVIEKKQKDDETPLTKKQRIEMEKMRDWQERKKNGDSVKPKSDKAAPVQSKLAAALIKGKPAAKAQDKPEPERKKIDWGAKHPSAGKTSSPTEKPEPEARKKIDWGPKHPGAGRMNGTTNGSTVDSKKSVSQSAFNSSAKDSGRPSSNVEKNGAKGVTKDVKRTVGDDKRVMIDKKSLDRTKEKEMLQRQMGKSKQDSRPKQFPPNDLRPKQFPPNDLRPKQFPPNDLRRKPMSNKMQMKKRRIIDDDDEEYDSEMDDFIDDGPEEEEDYSKHIQEIFGYNKSKYAYVDDDEDDIMESSFCQMMKEEQISTRMGIMEDLEDMKMEEEHKRRKALMKKKMRK